MFDPDLPVLAKHKAEFESMGVKVIVSDLDVVTVCNDKWRTFIFLKESGLNVPKTFINVEDALQALQNKDIAYPACGRQCGSGNYFVQILHTLP